MTSIPNPLKDRLGIGETFCLAVEDRDGTLVATHPNPDLDYGVAVVEGLDQLGERDRYDEPGQDDESGRCEGPDRNEEPDRDDGSDWNDEPDPDGEGDRIEERPTGPIEVELQSRFVDGRIAGRVVGIECDEAANRT